jgi:hypothetical protein
MCFGKGEYLHEVELQCCSICLFVKGREGRQLGEEWGIGEHVNYF